MDGSIWICTVIILHNSEGSIEFSHHVFLTNISSVADRMALNLMAYHGLSHHGLFCIFFIQISAFLDFSYPDVKT